MADGKRPPIPALEELPGGGFEGLMRFMALLQRCWAQAPADRPAFPAIIQELRWASLHAAPRGAAARFRRMCRAAACAALLHAPRPPATCNSHSKNGGVLPLPRVSVRLPTGAACVTCSDPASCCAWPCGHHTFPHFHTRFTLVPAPSTTTTTPPGRELLSLLEPGTAQSDSCRNSGVLPLLELPSAHLEASPLHQNVQRTVHIPGQVLASPFSAMALKLVPPGLASGS